jgi:hypothetical protein
MRLYVFVLMSAESTLDFLDSFDTQPSYSVMAPDLGSAVVALAAYSYANLDGSSDPQDYHDDIDEGSIAVYCPTNIAK